MPAIVMRESRRPSHFLCTSPVDRWEILGILMGSSQVLFRGPRQPTLALGTGQSLWRMRWRDWQDR